MCKSEMPVLCYRRTLAGSAVSVGVTTLGDVESSGSVVRSSSVNPAFALSLSLSPAAT